MQNVMKTVVFILLVSLSIEAKENRFTTSVSLLGMSMDYRETNKEGGFSNSEKSNFYDLVGCEIEVGLLMYKNNLSNTVLKTKFLILTGRTDYTGSYIVSGLPAYGKNPSTLTDLDISIEENYYLSNNIGVNYSLGVGYRFWKRTLNANQIEDYEWYSLRGMVGTYFKITNSLKVASEIEYQYGFKETMYASNLDSTFDLGNANIFQISIPIVYSYTKSMDIIFEATYEQQEIGVSNVINGWYEPQSTAKNQYIKIGLDFKY